MLTVSGRNKLKINLNTIIRSSGLYNLLEQSLSNSIFRINYKMSKGTAVAGNYKMAAGLSCFKL